MNKFLRCSFETIFNVIFCRCVKAVILQTIMELAANQFMAKNSPMKISF